MAAAQDRAAELQQAKQRVEDLDAAMPLWPVDGPKRWRVGPNANLQVFDVNGATALAEFSPDEVRAVLAFLTEMYG